MSRNQSPELTTEILRDVLYAAHSIVLLRGVLADAPARCMLDLLALLESSADALAISQAYSRTFQALATVADETMMGLADAWQNYLVTRLIEDDNPWSRQAERVGVAHVATGLREQAQCDLRTLRRLYDINASALHQFIQDAVGGAMAGFASMWVPWLNLAVPVSAIDENSARMKLFQDLVHTPDWTTSAPHLEDYWAHHGTGVLARHHILRWDSQTKKLDPIQHPDVITLDGLIGYVYEQELLQRNVEHFLHKLPAHDMLLYGPPGTGKSSTVKAIANTYASDGLHLIEVRKKDIADLPVIAAAIRGRAPRFLVFIDDLSFEEHEIEYKALKALLEGTAEARPENMLLCATTNRRNLVHETFADRDPVDDLGEPSGRDTMAEKISLAARFGLRITFNLPNQEEYSAIATGLAQKRGIILSADDLRVRALAWERTHPGRSGRTARQFVDELEAEQRTLGRSVHH